MGLFKKVSQQRHNLPSNFQGFDLSLKKFGHGARQHFIHQIILAINLLELL